VERESYNRQTSISRGCSQRGGERNQEFGPDGWAVAGGSVSRPPPNPQAGNLSQFGKISKGAPMAMGPSSMVAGGNKGSRPTSWKPSIDLGQAGVPKPPLQRKKLQLLPRSKPTAEENTPATSEDEPESAPTDMSEADAKKRIGEDVKEFFAVRSLEEADVYFTNLTPEHHFRLVDKLVASALESKEADARLVGEFFARAVSNGLCTMEVFEEGFMPMAEFLDDIAIDAPKAFDYMAIMLTGAGFGKEPERLQRIASKLEDSHKLVSLMA
jgi:translation initiation factor 4G